MYYHRTLGDAWLNAADQFPVMLLTGPRQVGKTTLLLKLAERGRQYVTLDDPALADLARRDPALFLDRFEPPVLIDEIQYAPQLLPFIKMAVAERGRRSASVWLTGSQPFHLMKGVSETLAGRVAIHNLLGFSARERRRKPGAVPFLVSTDALRERGRTAAVGRLGRVFADLWLGGYPALATGAVTERDLFCSSYVQTYLQRDVRDLVQVGDAHAFLRFLKACAARTAQLLNLSELARDVDIAVNTAKHWLSVLLASYQVLLVPPYHTNVTKRLVKAPKLYFTDTGLCSYLTEWSTPQALEAGAMNGAIFETHVVMEVLKSWWNHGLQPPFYYYRDKSGREIDLLFVQDGAMHAIEIKKSASPREEWTRAFAALEQFRSARLHAAVVCMVRDIVPLDARCSAVPVGYI